MTRRPAARPLDRAALIVFARVPVPGRVKTRLTPPLLPRQAAALYDAFLRDALDAWTAPGAFGDETRVDVRLYLAGGEPVPPGLVPDGVSVHPQRGLAGADGPGDDGLGARMHRAFLETFAAGYERAVVIGTDHPTLPDEFVAMAFDLLATPFRVVLGPSADGGYYLLGLNEVYADLFAGLTYSHPDVLTEAIKRADGAGAEVVLLPPWYDVDTIEEVRRLHAEAAAGTPLPPRTAAALARLLDERGGVL